MIKKLFFGVVILMAILLVCPADEVVAGEVASAIHIKDAQGLLDMAKDPGGSYILDTDIDMAGVPWRPFEFRGTLDGGGYAILNLSVSETGDARYTTYDGNYKEYSTAFSGMFDAIVGASIKDLSLVNFRSDISADDSVFSGSLAGYSFDSVMENINITATEMLSVDAPMFGVGGLIGYGAGKARDCIIDTTLVCVDRNAAERDEQFLGGVFAAGFLDVDNCNIRIRGFDSDHGYVHNGGIVGMYVFFPRGITYRGSMCDNHVEGTITFFEDNTNRRAYCAPFAGESMTWEYEYTGNTEKFTRDEIMDYSKDLYPNTCGIDDYDTETVPGSCEGFGYTLYKCKNCDYSYTDHYTLKVHSPGEEIIIKEQTFTEEGISESTCTQCGTVFTTTVPMKEMVLYELKGSDASEDKKGESDAADTPVTSEETGVSGGKSVLYLALSILAILTMTTLTVVVIRRRR